MYSDLIKRQFKALKEAEKNLSRIRKKYENDPDLLSFYEPSAQYIVEDIKKQIRELASEFSKESNMQNADFIIRLKGPIFENGRAPLGVVGTYIKNLSNANQHAVTLLENVVYEGKRITKRIKEMAELDIIAAAPGSLQLGLKKPALEKFLKPNANEQICNQETITEESYVLDVIDSAKENAERAADGMKLISRAIIASDNNDEFQKLYSEMKEPKNLLKLLHYAREITPARVSEINEVTITNLQEKQDNLREVIITAETRQKITERSKALISEGLYIEGTGIVRAVDFDKMVFRINGINVNEENINEIECRVNRRNFSEHILRRIANMPVKVLGVLMYTAKGEPNYIDIDEISIL